MRSPYSQGGLALFIYANMHINAPLPTTSQPLAQGQVMLNTDISVF